MIPSIPDLYEYAYCTISFFAGRHYAGNAYRKETEELEEYQKLTLRQRQFKSRPEPAVESAAAFLVTACLWPAFLGWQIAETFKEAHDGKIHAAKIGLFSMMKLVFLGRRPRAERRQLERKQMEERIEELEKELELNA